MNIVLIYCELPEKLTLYAVATADASVFTSMAFMLKSTISRHLKNIFMDGELDKNAVVANFATTASDGKFYQVDYYNLDVIISVGYRVKS